MRVLLPAARTIAANGFVVRVDDIGAQTFFGACQARTGSPVTILILGANLTPGIVYVCNMAPGQGFEPRYSEPKSDVLPLNDPGTHQIILSGQDACQGEIREDPFLRY